MAETVKASQLKWLFVLVVVSILLSMFGFLNMYRSQQTAYVPGQTTAVRTGAFSPTAIKADEMDIDGPRCADKMTECLVDCSLQTGAENSWCNDVCQYVTGCMPR